MGAGLFTKAIAKAYRISLFDTSKTAAAGRRASKLITEEQARKILGVTENAAWVDIKNKYDILLARRFRPGNSHSYLKSKVHQAKECLEAVYQNKGQGPYTT